MWWKVTGGLHSCPAAVLSFFRYSAFFFLVLFSFLQFFWACPFFFLQGAMLSLKSCNLNRFAKPTRCHPFNSFLQQPGVIICIPVVVILFGTRGSTPLKKMIMMKILSRKFFIEAATCTAAKGRDRKKASKRWGKRAYEEYMECFCYWADCCTRRVLVHFFQVLLTWLIPLKLNTLFCSLQWVEKVTAQMIPSSSPLVKVSTWLVVRDKYSVHVRSHAVRLCPCSLWPVPFRWKVWSMILWRKRPERNDIVHEFPVWNVHEAHGRSTAVGRNAPSRTQTIILQVIYFGVVLNQFYQSEKQKGWGAQLKVPRYRYETLEVAKPSRSALESRSFLFQRAFFFDRHTCTYLEERRCRWEPHARYCLRVELTQWRKRPKRAGRFLHFRSPFKTDPQRDRGANEFVHACLLPLLQRWSYAAGWLQRLLPTRYPRCYVHRKINEKERRSTHSFQLKRAAHSE